MVLLLNLDFPRFSVTISSDLCVALVLATGEVLVLEALLVTGPPMFLSDRDYIAFCSDRCSFGYLDTD